ncbi:phosphate ABC transporter permease subunit PstC [Maritalea mediterranea]|uniref:Phosphate transport system permease protein n=1 Tax=Maritalea mediterranea TaxID=2909667 RepID=A0ABS9E3W9_9HYPH|nr:phosphate ABC transporter permease subunit PstC [Maritalea mediterranea]MCF4097570.1 phosphate ABC transporter permease subunit PstC [Maritalea mediterranea]
MVLTACALFYIGRSRAVATVGGDPTVLHSKPGFHGAFVMICGMVPAVLLFFTWLLFSRYLTSAYVTAQLGADFANLATIEQNALIRNMRSFADRTDLSALSQLEAEAVEHYRAFVGRAALILQIVIGVLVVAGGWFAMRAIHQELRARQFVEKTVMSVLIAASGVAILTTLGIVLSLIFESVNFFQKVNFLDFLFGTHWSPQSAFEGVGEEATDRNSEVFGAIPVFAGTLLITAIAILVAAPIGLMSAIYLSDYASPKVRATAKPIMEILAGIPTVVYGFFAALTVAPFFRNTGEAIGISVSSESALAAGLVMGIMIIPFVSSLSDDVINSVPQSLRDGSAGLGATKSETIRRVILPAALPGIVSALMLAISRAIGETMIVVMAAGLSANMTVNPLEAVTTVTVQIVTLLVGDQEFDSAKTLAAFALGLVLFCVTLLLNVIALRVIKKYREQYD